jgi:amino acid permease
MNKNISKIAFIIGLAFSIASIVLATDYGLSPQLNTVIDNLKRILQAIGIIIAAFGIIYGGFQIITAGGSSEKVESGRKWIMYAIVGLVIVLIGWLLTGIACYIGTGNWTCPSTPLY